jgi:hypothetical protein
MDLLDYVSSPSRICNPNGWHPSPSSRPARSQPRSWRICNPGGWRSSPGPGRLWRASLARCCLRGGSNARQHGAGAAEFIVIALPLIFLGLCAFETARWLSARHLLSVALYEAARAGSVQHAHPAVIESAFQQALAPLEAGQRGRSRSRGGQTAWQISVLSPAPGAFLDFADRAAARHANGAHANGAMAIINNHYLAQQHARHRARGWPDGRGPQSGQDIFQANTLTLRLRYPFKPLVPGVAAILRSLAGGNRQRETADGKRSALARKPVADPGPDSMLRQGYLPILREVSVVMQSHPQAWPLPHGRIHGRP